MSQHEAFARALEEARSWASAMYEDFEKWRHDIMFTQGWEAASEAIEERIRAIPNPYPAPTTPEEKP